MARNAASQLLDELMGRQRDLDPNQKNKATIRWNDSQVCKHYLVKFCPSSLFTNTKADIGPCNLVHDEFIKRDYQTKASKREKRMFEEEFIRFCQNQLNDVDRKINRAKQRLEMSQMEKNSHGESLVMLSEHNQERLNVINEKIEKLLEEIEQLGCEGKVEEAQAIMKSLDKLKEEKIAVKRENQPGHWIQQKAEIGVAQEKQMEVCDVCGAFLIVNDVQQRVEDHLMGKQHVGYGRLKTALDELLEKRSQEGSGPSLEERTQSRSAAGDQRKESNQRGHHSGGSSSSSRPVFRDHRSRSDHKSNNNNNNNNNHLKRHRSRSPPSSKSHRRSESDRKRTNFSSSSRSSSTSTVNGASRGTK